MASVDSLSLMNAVMQGVNSSDEWDTALGTDPRIKQAEAAFMEIASKLPERTLWDLETAFNAAISAYTDAAFLFGVHFMECLRTVSANPYTLSQYVIERAEMQHMEA